MQSGRQQQRARTTAQERKPRKPAKTKEKLNLSSNDRYYKDL